VAGEVELRGLAVAERGQECYVEELVVAGVACVGQAALVAVLAPVDGDSCGVGGFEEGNEQQREQQG